MKKIIFFTFVFVIVLVVGCTQQNPNVAPEQPLIKNVDILLGEGTYDVVTEEVAYHGNTKGFLAKPSQPGIYPGVVMIHEWWGLNDNIKDMARLLASQGYVVLAVDLFGKVAATPDEARQLTGAVRNDSTGAIANLKGAVNYLKTLEEVDDSKIASMGWCFGGGMSLQLSLNEKLAATIIYYGSLETDASKLSVISWPVLGIFGEVDTSILVESVKQFEAALNENSIENEIYIYPGVGHAFANPSGMSYAPAETNDAWQKTVGFLNKHLKS